MAKLTNKERKAIPKSKFANPSKAPGSGSFPIEDVAHIRAAKTFERFANPATKKKIDAAAAKAGVGKAAKKSK